MAGIRAVIFDLDGCLVDSETMSLETLAETMREEGVTASFDELRQRFLGVTIQTVCAHVAVASGRPCPEDFATRFETRLLARYPGVLRPVAGVPHLLDDLDRLGIATAIATGGSVRRMQATLAAAGLADRFAGRAFSADQVERGKPAPDLFLFAAQALGVEPEACAVMEDSPHGIAGSRAAGMRAIGFVGGGHLRGMRDDHAARLWSAGAMQVLDDLSGMRAALLDES